MRRLVVVLCAAALVGAFVAPVAAASPPAYLQKTIVKGAAIHGANGLAIDSHGRLLVASVWGQQIVAVNRLTGKVLQRYGPTYKGVQIGTPDDVAVGPDGSIYWTDLMGGMVGRIDPAGNIAKQAVAAFVNPIAFNAQGRLFVGQAFMGDCLYEIDPALAAPPVKILCGSGEANFPDQLNGFDFGPDGLLYSPRPNRGQIVSINVATKAVAVVSDLLPGTPSSVEFDAHGRLFASIGEGPVVRVDTATGDVRLVTTLAFGLDNMVFDATGRLFVSNSNDGRLDRVLPDSGDHRQLLGGGMIVPGGVAVLPGQSGDRVLVGDLWTLLTYNGRTGRLMDSDANFGAFGIPGALSVSPDGDHVLITTWLAGLVERWDPVTNTLDGVYGGFGTPLNAIRFGTDLVVAALGPAPVVRRAANGMETQLGVGSVFVPTGLAATADDLWVADWATGIIWQLVRDGANLGAPTFVAGGLVQPEGMALDRDGSLLVVEAGEGRLTRVDPGTGAKSTVASGLALGTPGPSSSPPTWMFNAVAVGLAGDIYVTGDRSDVLYRFSPVP